MLYLLKTKPHSKGETKRLKEAKRLKEKNGAQGLKEE
jgi:hypothetical protein